MFWALFQNCLRTVGKFGDPVGKSAETQVFFMNCVGLCRITIHVLQLNLEKNSEVPFLVLSFSYYTKIQPGKELHYA